MNKIFLRTGGAINLLFVIFHFATQRSLGDVLTSLSADLVSLLFTMNMQTIFILLIFAYFDIFRWRELTSTRLGKSIAITISLFWFLRGTWQIMYFNHSSADLPFFGLCLIFGLIHLIPVIRGRAKARDKISSREDSRNELTLNPKISPKGLRWASYMSVAWCIVFGGLHLYWALGGNAGFVELSMPSSKVLAMNRDPGYMGITWLVVIMSALAAFLALAPLQSWSRRIPGWLILTPLWIACCLFLLRGIGTPIQTALVMGGGLVVKPPDPSMQEAWHQWGLLDLTVFCPWFILGGLAFGMSAWFAQRIYIKPAGNLIIENSNDLSRKN